MWWPSARPPRRTGAPSLATGSLSAAVNRAAPAVVSVSATKPGARNPHDERPVVPLLLRRPRAGRGATRRRLGRDRVAAGLPAHQQPRRRRRQRDRGRPQGRPRGQGPAGRHRPRNRRRGAEDRARPPARHHAGQRRGAARGRSGAGDRQPVQRRPDRHLGHRQRARAQPARPVDASKTSFRPTPPSTPATRAARWSTSTASWWASTPRSSRAPAAAWASASRFRSTWRAR